MSIILHLKHWQVFLLLFLFMIVGNFEVEDWPVTNQILGTTGFLLYLGTLITYGHYLYDLLPKNVELNYNLFIVNCFILIATVFVLTFLLEKTEISASGLYALPIFYLFYALWHAVAFPAKALRSIELKREAKLEEYIGMFIMVILWPICIWFIQPRVNRIAEQEPASQNS